MYMVRSSMKKIEEQRLVIIAIAALFVLAIIGYGVMQWEAWAPVIFFGAIGVYAFCKATKKCDKVSWKGSLLWFMLSLLFLAASATWTAENIGASSQLQDSLYSAILIIGGCGIASLVVVGITTLIKKN